MKALFAALFAAGHIVAKGGMASMKAPAVDGVKLSTNNLESNCSPMHF